MWLRMALMLLVLNLIIAVAVRSFSKPQPPPPKIAEPAHMELREATTTKLAALELFETFERRWDLTGLTRPNEVRDTLFVASPPTTGVADKVPVVAVYAGRAQSPRHHRSESDVCARHGLHRVNYTKPNGWKYWRCR
jgi:hypothetical protein